MGDEAHSLENGGSHSNQGQAEMVQAESIDRHPALLRSEIAASLLPGIQRQTPGGDGTKYYTGGKEKQRDMPRSILLHEGGRGLVLHFELPRLLGKHAKEAKEFLADLDRGLAYSSEGRVHKSGQVLRDQMASGHCSSP